MTRNAHDEARQRIALGEDLSDAERTELRLHLDACEACRHYAETASGVVRTLQLLQHPADTRLVRATQMRVHFHASRLRETRERMWLAGTACLAVGFFTTLTFPLLWRLFGWIGERAGVSTMISQMGFLFFVFASALVVAVWLLARGTYLTNDGEQSQA